MKILTLSVLDTIHKLHQAIQYSDTFDLSNNQIDHYQVEKGDHVILVLKVVCCFIITSLFQECKGARQTNGCRVFCLYDNHLW